MALLFRKNSNQLNYPIGCGLCGLPYAVAHTIQTKYNLNSPDGSYPQRTLALCINCDSVVKNEQMKCDLCGHIMQNATENWPDLAGTILVCLECNHPHELRPSGRCSYCHNESLSYKDHRSCNARGLIRQKGLDSIKSLRRLEGRCEVCGLHFTKPFFKPLFRPAPVKCQKCEIKSDPVIYLREDYSRISEEYKITKREVDTVDYQAIFRSIGNNERI